MLATKTGSVQVQQRQAVLLLLLLLLPLLRPPPACVLQQQPHPSPSLPPLLPLQLVPLPLPLAQKMFALCAGRKGITGRPAPKLSLLHLLLRPPPVPIELEVEVQIQGPIARLRSVPASFMMRKLPPAVIEQQQRNKNN